MRHYVLHIIFMMLVCIISLAAVIIMEGGTELDLLSLDQTTSTQEKVEGEVKVEKAKEVKQDDEVIKVKADESSNKGTSNCN